VRPSLPLPCPLIALLLFAAGSCSVYDDSLLHHVDAGQDASWDAAPDGLTSDASDAADVQSEPEAQGEAADEPLEDVMPDVDPRGCDTCKDLGLARPPCPRGAADEPSGDPIVFAMRTLSMGLSPGSDLSAWKAIGYDLDCLQTGASGTPLTCKAAEPLTMEDGESGRDNSFGRNIGGGIRLICIEGLFPDVEAQANARMDAGTIGWVAVLRDYNGGDDDPAVRVALHPSNGVVDAGGQPKSPLWDGTDLWSVDSSSMQGGTTPVHEDVAAYVAAGVVVARFAGPLPFTVRGDASALALSLEHVVVTLELSVDRKQVLRGTIAGISPIGQVMHAVDDFAAQAGACPGVNKNVDDARLTMLKTADVLMSLASDQEAACDGMTAGLAFTAVAAKLGAVSAPVPIDVPPCSTDAGTASD